MKINEVSSHNRRGHKTWVPAMTNEQDANQKLSIYVGQFCILTLLAIEKGCVAMRYNFSEYGRFHKICHYGQGCRAETQLYSHEQEECGILICIAYI